MEQRMRAMAAGVAERVHAVEVELSAASGPQVAAARREEAKHQSQAECEMAENFLGLWEKSAVIRAKASKVERAARDARTELFFAELKKLNDLTEVMSDAIDAVEEEGLRNRELVKAHLLKALGVLGEAPAGSDA